MYFKTWEGQKHLKFQQSIHAFGDNPISNHMLMWYLNKDDIDHLSSAKVISFKFHPRVSRRYNESNFKVERCGIHMIYLQDVVDLGIITSEFVHEESNVITNQPSPSRLEIIDLESKGPCPKRTKFSSFPWLVPTSRPTYWLVYKIFLIIVLICCFQFLLRIYLDVKSILLLIVVLQSSHLSQWC